MSGYAGVVGPSIQAQDLFPLHEFTSPNSARGQTQEGALGTGWLPLGLMADLQSLALIQYGRSERLEYIFPVNAVPAQ